MKRLAFILLLAGSCAFGATTVTDTLYNALGQRISATLTVQWPTFTAASGNVVPAGTKRVAVTNGALSIQLESNTDATPSGTYYTVTYVSQPGVLIQTTEHWIVPATGTANLSAVRTSSSPIPSLVVALTQLSKSGATDGQAVVWSDSAAAWIPGTVSGGANLPHVTNIISGDGAGNGADSGIAPASVVTLTGSQVVTNKTINGVTPTVFGYLDPTSSVQTQLNGKAAANVAITGATKTKITYDSKGLVTAGADATTADIADSSDKRYVTDSQKTVIQNTSGANTGDQTNVTGNAGTATALAANPANCSSGNLPRGIDASGVAEGCNPVDLTADVGATILPAANTAVAVLNDSVAYCADAGASDTYACSLSPAPASYATGGRYRFKANTANTGAASINLNSLGAKTIVKVAGGVTTTLADNDILSGQVVDVVYDGTNMQMQSTLGNAPTSGITVGTTAISGGTNGRIEYNNSGVIGEYNISGTGNVCMTTNCVMTTPNVGRPSAIDLTNGTAFQHTFGATFQNSGNALVAGATGYFTSPWGCTISAWNITATPADTATVDIWKTATGTAVPTVSNTITASAVPAISTGTAVHSTTLSGWTTAVSANDIFGINLKLVGGTATQVNLTVQCQ